MWCCWTSKSHLLAKIWVLCSQNMYSEFKCIKGTWFLVVECKEMDSWQWVHDSLTHNRWQFLKALGKLQWKLNYYFCSLHVGIVLFHAENLECFFWNNIEFSSSGKWRGMVSVKGSMVGFFFWHKERRAWLQKGKRTQPKDWTQGNQNQGWWRELHGDLIHNRM